MAPVVRKRTQAAPGNAGQRAPGVPATMLLGFVVFARSADRAKPTNPSRNKQGRPPEIAEERAGRAGAGSVAAGGVVDGADQFFDHVLQEEDAGGVALTGD